MPLDLNAMALFVRVVEHKSFSATSKRLGVPISTLSRKISNLEKALGVRLLERSTRKLRLTELGQTYYGHCRRGLEEFETGTLMINDRQAEVAGTLRLSIPPSLADVLVVPLVCAFQAAFPKVTVKILVSERNVDLVEEGVDIALRVGELENSSLVARPLLTYRHILVASPDYLKANGTPSHPDDLSNHRLITFGGWYDRVVWELVQKRHVHKVSAESALVLNDHTGILNAVEAGKGIAESPAIICGRALKAGRLVEVLPQWRFAPTTLSAVCPSNRNTSRLVRLFKDFCVEHIEKPAPYTGI